MGITQVKCSCVLIMEGLESRRPKTSGLNPCSDIDQSERECLSFTTAGIPRTTKGGKESRNSNYVSEIRSHPY